MKKIILGFLSAIFSFSVWSACHFTFDARNVSEYSPAETDFVKAAYEALTPGSEIIVFSLLGKRIEKIKSIEHGKKGLCDNKTKFMTIDDEIVSINDAVPAVKSFRTFNQNDRVINTFSRLPFVTGDDEVRIQGITFDGHILIDRLLLLRADYFIRPSNH